MCRHLQLIRAGNGIECEHGRFETRAATPNRRNLSRLVDGKHLLGILGGSGVHPELEALQPVLLSASSLCGCRFPGGGIRTFRESGEHVGLGPYDADISITVIDRETKRFDLLYRVRIMFGGGHRFAEV